MHHVTAVHTYPTDIGISLYSISLTDFNGVADKVTVMGFRAQIVRHVVIAEQESQVLLNGHKIPHPDVLSGLERLVRNTVFIQDFGDGTVRYRASLRQLWQSKILCCYRIRVSWGLLLSELPIQWTFGVTDATD